MPFKNREDGTVTWVPPTDDDVKETYKSICEGETHSGVDHNLTEELRNKANEVLNAVIPARKWGIIVHSNEKVYDTIKAISSSPRGLVDIILPVHNAIHITKQCINAVLTRTNWPFHIWIVDDASDLYTHNELVKIQKENPDNISLITNIKNKGFAASVNKGIKAGNGEFVCLLNSDVLVTPMWLTKMVMAHKADPKNQIVCPATNNTAVVNIPMSPGASYLQMNRIFEQFAVRKYPEILPTGFCFLFPRNLVDKIGYFDEGYTQGYGEESDWHMRAIHYTDGPHYPKYRAVMADDTYVFHEREASFSKFDKETHMFFRKIGNERFHNLWPQWQSWNKTYSVKRALGHLRDPIPAHLVKTEGKYHICWVVHSATMCGGMRYIADIVNEINEKGGNARVALIKREQNSNESYIGELRTAPIIFQDYDDFTENFTKRVFSKGIVVAATAELVGVVKSICDVVPTLKPLLHTQSYEMELLPSDTAPEMIETVKLAFKAFPNVISNSHWISETLEKELNVKSFATISPGVDQDLFYPRGRDNGDERLTVMLPILQTYDCKGFDRGVALVQDIERAAVEKGLEVRILVYGAMDIPILTSAICLGPLTQTRLAQMLGTEVDVFVDPSTLHSYGMPALEAVASNVAVVGWDNKGIREYLNNDSFNIFPNDTSTEAVADNIINLLMDDEKRKSIIEEQRKILTYHDRRKSTNEFVEAIEKHFDLTTEKRDIVMVVPHMRKHGGPTTLIELANKLADRGHNVSLTTVYTDINPEVAGMTELDINIDAQSIPKCDLLITNSDNPMAEALSKLRYAKKKIMVKLSHNPRFKQLEEQGLNCKWDAVVTSSNWLKDVCENPTKDWNYKPTKATRIGWWHYAHEIMCFDSDIRKYNEGTDIHPINIGTLVHHHPSKGTKEAILALGALFRDMGPIVRFTCIGEMHPDKFGMNLPSHRYKYSPNRQEMADILSTCDIWLGASHNEGLGRMALEAMSAGCACVLSDTGAEYAKDGENCLLYPVGDIPAMLNALRKLIADRDLAKKIRDAGHLTAHRLSDPEECIDNLEAVIREVFGE